MARILGANSEVGVLKTVMVCHPGLAHERLTPTNCSDLLYDDVIWVEQAKRDHRDFVSKMEERGVRVLEMHDLLEQVLDLPEGRKYILDRRIIPGYIGVQMAKEARPWLDEMPSAQLAKHLIGGIAPSELPFPHEGIFSSYLDDDGFVLAPLPNSTFTRDTTCWIYGGVTLNPMFWPARKQETLLTTAIYKYHPFFTKREFEFWWGDPETDQKLAFVEGGDVMPVGKGCVLIGMGERTTALAAPQMAQALVARVTGKVDQLNEIKDSISLVEKMLSDDDISEDIKERTKAAKDTIKYFIELINAPEDVQGIQRSPDILSTRLSMLNYYISSAIDRPNQSQQIMLNQVSGEVEKVVGQIDEWLDEEWEETQQIIEAARLSPFMKENEQ